MRVLVLYAHPVEDSFCAALHRTVVAGLEAGGHAVDDCDLYAEGFDPVLSREGRCDYHDTNANRAGVEPYVDRLLSAEALVLVHPVWNFGMPAILKGFLDRVFLPGVSFGLVEGQVRPALHNITRLGVATTYGATRWRAAILGDPPRKIAKRMLRAVIKPGAPVDYLALYDMNNAGVPERGAFLTRVETGFKAW